jgi:hypothetical protein
LITGTVYLHLCSNTSSDSNKKREGMR